MFPLRQNCLSHPRRCYGFSNGWTKPIIADVATIADTAITFVLRLMLCDIINILSSDFWRGRKSRPPL